MKNLNEIIHTVKPILKKHNIVKASLFGSAVRGELKNTSDIDILVEMPLNVSLFDVLNVKVDLEAHLGRKVDLVQFKTIKSHAKDIILSTQVPIYTS